MSANAKIVAELRNAICGALTGPMAAETGTAYQVVAALIAIAVDLATACHVDAAFALSTYLVQVEPDEKRAMMGLMRVYAAHREANADIAIQAARDACALANATRPR